MGPNATLCSTVNPPGERARTVSLLSGVEIDLFMLPWIDIRSDYKY
jgi:hypothetical protein